MKVQCANEYDPLKKAIFASPKYMAIKDPINETQKKYKNINSKIAEKQHADFIEKLRQYHIETILLPEDKKFHEQVFTRDIGFTLGSQFFIAELAPKVRKGEVNILIDYLESQQITYTNINGSIIEGGDVLIDGNTIYVGVSNRTNLPSIHTLQALLPNYHIIPIPFIASYLHLDCVFNILSPTEGLIFPGVFHKDKELLLRNRYDLIEVSKKEQATLGINVLSIGNKKIISLPTSEEVNKALQKRGYDVIEMDFSEIIKSGGSFRCCALPLWRE